MLSEALQNYLRKVNVPFQVLEQSPAYTAQEAAAKSHIPGARMAKVVVAFIEGRMAVLVLPATHRIDLTRVAAFLGTREIRLAKEDEFAAAFPDCEIGAISPLGNLYGLDVYVDQSLVTDEHIAFKAGDHGHIILMPYPYFEQLQQPYIGRFAYHHGAIEPILTMAH